MFGKLSMSITESSEQNKIITQWEAIKNTNIINIKCQRVKEIDTLNVKPQRGGVILYTVYNNIIYIGLGVDAPTHDLTDFAGGITYKKENIIEGSLREFQEETLNIFENITLESIMDCLVLYEKNNFVIFIPINCDPDLISKTFNIKYQNEILKLNKLRSDNSPEKDPEVCGITWLTLEEFKSSINDNTPEKILYSRTRNFLRRGGDFFHLF